jgi:MFS family permease
VQRFTALTGKGLGLLLFIWFLWFMSFTTRTIFSPILPLLENEFGVSHARASSIFMSFSTGYSLSVFFAGFFASHLGAKKSVLLSIGLSVVVFLLIPFVHIFELFYLLTFMLGTAAGMYLPSMIPLLTDYYAENVWGRVIAMHDSGAPISVFCAPFIALAILAFFPWRGIFVVLAVIFAACGVVFYFLTEERKFVRGKYAFPASLWRRKELWCLGTVAVFMGGSSLGLFYVIPLYLVQELSMPAGYANAILGISRIGGVVVAIGAGFVVDRFSLKKTMLTVTLVTGLFTILLALGGVAWIKSLLFIQASFVTGYFPTMFVSVSRLFGPETRGQATGILLTLAAVFGTGLIPYLLGVSGDLVSFRFGIFLLGALTTLSSGLILLLKDLR